MNKTISINISGLVFNIEEQAYDILKDYLDSIKTYFKSQEGGSEIIADIEARIAELFQQKVSDDKAAITLDDVESVIQGMGQPFEMVDEEETNQEETKEEKTSHTEEPRERKVFRNPDEKVLGGVCSGLAAYFGIDTVWVRLIFIMVALWGGGGALIYIILWIAIPEAVTTADRLRMRGKPVNVSNIEESIRNSAKEIGDDISDFISNPEHRKSFGKGTKQASNVIQRIISAVVQVIGFVVKTAFKIVAILLVIAGISALTALVLSFLASFGVFGFVFSDLITVVVPDGFQKVTLMVSVFLVILIPVLIVLVRAFQVLLKQGTIGKPYLVGAFAIWILCVIVLFVQGTSLLIDIRSSASMETEIALKNPGANRYYIASLEPKGRVNYHFGNHSSFSPDNFYFDDGRFFFKDVSLKIEKSNDEDFHLITRLYSKGRNYNYALENAKEVEYSIDQTDSSIILSPYISIEDAVYRGQDVLVVLLVPEGKEVVFENYTSDIENYIGRQTGFYYDYPNKIFKMSSDGLEHVAVVKSDSNNNDMIAYSMSGFTDVEIDSDENIRIELIEGSDYRVEVSKFLYNQKGFKVYRRGKELRVKVDDLWQSDLPDVPVHLRVVCPDFDEISCSGRSESYISSDRPGDLELNIYGASKSTVKGYFDDLDVRVAGIADITLTGTADRMDAEVTGSSKIHGFDMVVRTADLELHGVCQTELYVTELLRAEANGSSTLKYKGTPTLIQNTSGLSKIQHVEN